MRIIAGKAGGRRIGAPRGKGTRPATDRVREAVFSSLGQIVEDALVADLYAGSGSFGLEALSRGAASAVFVESGAEALRALRENLDSLGLGGRVVPGAVSWYLARSQDHFDLVFIDPPWSHPSESLSRELAILDPLLLPGGQVVLSRRKGDSLPEAPETWRVATDKAYGDTRLVRYTKGTDDDRTLPGQL